MYRRSLFSSITPLLCDSNHFCAVKLHDSCGVSVLVVCVYMPAQSHSFCFDEYLSTIGELEGFSEFHKCDVNLLVGDFNVDFSRGGMKPISGIMFGWKLDALNPAFYLI